MDGKVSGMPEMTYLANVVTLELDQSICTGCGMCIDVCPHNVFALHDNRAVIARRDSCMECGACARNCPENALAVQAGVGCAYAVIVGAIKGTEPDCCSGDTDADCC